ncbi:NrtR DNA-binding winged helix domain-containing protein [Jatrophihabitans fulvus]
MARTNASQGSRSSSGRRPAARTPKNAGSGGFAGAARPYLTVDVAMLGLIDDGSGGWALSVLEVKRDGGGWILPGVLVGEGERLAAAASRALAEAAGLPGVPPASARQLRVLDAPDRDDRGWVMSVGHVVVATDEQWEGRGPSTRVVAASSPGRLPYGHGEIVAAAVADLQARYAAAPDPDGLLGDSFTLRDLRLVHEAIAGHELQRDTFRRSMEPMLASTGDVLVGGRGRPAELFTRA